MCEAILAVHWNVCKVTPVMSVQIKKVSVLVTSLRSSRECVADNFDSATRQSVVEVVWQSRVSCELQSVRGDVTSGLWMTRSFMSPACSSLMHYERSGPRPLAATFHGASTASEATIGWQFIRYNCLIYPDWASSLWNLTKWFRTDASETRSTR